MKGIHIFRLLRQRLDTTVHGKELRMTFISPHRGSQVSAVVVSRSLAPQLVGLPSARERRGEMSFSFSAS
jgi:hypothetical protein